MESEIGVLQVEKRIRNRVKRQMEKTQREYYLNEQLKAIQKELGEGEDGKDENAELEAKIKKTKLSKEAREKAMAELKKLKTMSPMSAEATVVRNYLDWMLSIPWKKRSKIRNDVVAAEKVLEADHYGLEKVKERIIEYLAVQARSPKVRGPILCLVGPPGVGKTSLGKSIAKATGRNFVRMSLGGVRDEAEIRGHRRTYIGSMPGKVIQGMKKAKTSNPLFLLDEVDKLGADWRGDPSSALLEVLDPEQNSTFNDHYLEVDYDLSDVMFVTTANSLRMPQPLMDRMEIIRIPGYTEDEKVEIAKRHLITKQSEAHGLKKDEWHISRRRAARPDPLLHARSRRAEPGARDRQPGPQVGEGDRHQEDARRSRSPGRTWRNIAGVQEVPLRRDRGRGHGRCRHRPGLDRGGRRDPDHRVGAAARQGQHQADRQAGRRDAGKRVGGAELCAQPLDQVRHQADAVRKARHPCARAGGRHAEGRPVRRRRDGDLDRVVLTGIPVRRDVAMTGEITLRGRVLPIGGLKEKLLAALRAGITTVFIPKENEKDLAEIPDNVKKHLKLIPVADVDEVIAQALARRPEPIEWEEPPEPVAAPGQPARRRCRTEGDAVNQRCGQSQLALTSAKSPPIFR